MPRPQQFPVKFVLGITKAMDRALADWRRSQPDLPSRSEAVRQLVSTALAAEEEVGAPTQLWDKMSAQEREPAEPKRKEKAKR